MYGEFFFLCQCQGLKIVRCGILSSKNDTQYTLRTVGKVVDSGLTKERINTISLTLIRCLEGETIEEGRGESADHV